MSTSIRSFSQDSFKSKFFLRKKSCIWFNRNWEFTFIRYNIHCRIETFPKRIQQNLLKNLEMLIQIFLLLITSQITTKPHKLIKLYSESLFWQICYNMLARHTKSIKFVVPIYNVTETRDSRDVTVFRCCGIKPPLWFVHFIGGTHMYTEYMSVFIKHSNQDSIMF